MCVNLLVVPEYFDLSDEHPSCDLQGFPQCIVEVLGVGPPNEALVIEIAHCTLVANPCLDGDRERV